jgi:hypothetical protein
MPAATRETAMADIFVSYTASDRDWAFWIAKELEALGHAPHIHEWEIKSGRRYLCLNGSAARRGRSCAFAWCSRVLIAILGNFGTSL